MAIPLLFQAKCRTRPGPLFVLFRQLFWDIFFPGDGADRFFIRYARVRLRTDITNADAAHPMTWVVYSNRTQGDLLRAAQSTTQTGLRARVNNLSASLQRRAGEQIVKQSAERLLSAMNEALEK